MLLDYTLVISPTWLSSTEAQLAAVAGSESGHQLFAPA